MKLILECGRDAELELEPVDENNVRVSFYDMTLDGDRLKMKSSALLPVSELVKAVKALEVM